MEEHLSCPLKDEQDAQPVRVRRAREESSDLCLGFLSLDTINTVGCVKSVGVGLGLCPVPCRIFSGIPGLYPVNASSNTTLLMCANYNFLQML